MPRINRTRLSFDVPYYVHDFLHKMKIKYNVTITKYILRIIVERMKQEEDWDKEK